MDSKIKEALDAEMKRQQDNVELIASENYVSKAVLELQGSIFTNKYAEGYPSKRYYGGCENVDTVENLAINYVTKLFHANYANVQPHSGSSANMAVYRALLEPGDKVMGLNLSHGGHLTHGNPVNFSGLDYKFVAYNLNPETGEEYEEGDPEKVPDNPRILELIDMRKREIAAALNAGGGLDPIILPFVDDEGNEILDAEGIDAIEPWATGFFMGAGVWADPILEGEDDNAFKHLARIARYAPLEADSPDDEALIERIEEAAGKKPETLADALYDVVESVFELKQYLRPNKPVRRESPRIGRNDPCPCGSGKKYKQCCGKN